MLTSAVLLFLYSLVNKIQYLIIFVQCTVQIFAKRSPKSVTSLADLGYYLLCIYFFIELFYLYANLLISAMFYLSYVNPTGISHALLPSSLFFHSFFLLTQVPSSICLLSCQETRWQRNYGAKSVVIAVRDTIRIEHNVAASVRVRTAKAKVSIT